MDTEHDWNNMGYVNQVLLRPDISSKESQDLYRQWAESNTYDKFLGDHKEYAALNHLTAAVKSVFPNPGNQLILDVGAGTGLTCVRLREAGYTNIDGLEPQPDFIKVCKEKNIYRKMFAEFIGAEKPLDIPDSVQNDYLGTWYMKGAEEKDTYDMIVTSGAFGPGHIPCSALPEMIRLLKPGGYMVNCMREEYTWTVPEYKDRLEPLFNQLVAEGKWKKIKWEIYPGHFVNKTGIEMIFQKC